MRTLTLTVTEAQAGRSVKTLLRREFHMAESLIARVKLRETGLQLNGQRVYTNAIVQAGDILTAEVGDDDTGWEFFPMEAPLDILFEDEDLLILNKAAGMAVHGNTERNGDCTVANALAFYLGPGTRFHPVNRLDKGTSGVMAVAKSGYIHDRMRRQLHSKQFCRQYLAITEGIVTPPAGQITLSIARDPNSRIKRKISADGLPACTVYETVQTGKDWALLHLSLKTGRTHQIRLHCAAIGYPLVGDWLYGTEAPDKITRPALHSAELELVHPITGQQMAFSAPLPEDMAVLMQ
ncbi:MAG: RluA family pseudouridine synthase [Oscillospiraceae bacterium]|jgi:23S rRNA pseudouridine1911/1915/1917 synthase